MVSTYLKLKINYCTQKYYEWFILQIKKYTLYLAFIELYFFNQ